VSRFRPFCIAGLFERAAIQSAKPQSWTQPAQDTASSSLSA
jgi:hypothetical protein